MNNPVKSKTDEYVLVNFFQNVFEIHKKHKVLSTDGNNCIVKYGGGSYAGVIVDVNASIQELQKLKKQCEQEYQLKENAPIENIEIEREIERKNNNINLSDFSFGNAYVDLSRSSISFCDNKDENHSSIKYSDLDEQSQHKHLSVPNCSTSRSQSEDLYYYNKARNYEPDTESFDEELDLQPCSKQNSLENAVQNVPILNISDNFNTTGIRSCNEENMFVSESLGISGDKKYNFTSCLDYSEDLDDSNKDRNYEPDTESSDEELDLQPCSKQNSLGNAVQNVSILNISDNLNTTGIRSCNEENMFVSESLGRSGDKKYNFCLFCKTKQMKISRHLQNKHKNEEAVKQFMQLPKNCTERNKCIMDLRKKGNYLFNSDRNFNDGELIVTRRPNKLNARTADYFRACPKCKAFFSKKTLRVHFKACANTSQKIGNVITLSKKVMTWVHEKASRRVRQELFPSLKDDRITRAVKYDELVVIYANKMVKKYKNVRHFEMIRQRIRLIGRLLTRLRSLNADITDLRSVYDPKYIDNTDKAINLEAGLNEDTDIYKTPTVASSLGTLLKQIGNILISECIKANDLEKKTQTENFLLLLSQEISIGINRTVAESQFQTQRRKVVDLPSTEDIERLHTYITAGRNEAFCKLKSKFSLEAWNQLCQFTLVCILLFNRRRAGELERVLIEDFNSYHGINNTDTVFQSLSEKNRSTAKKYVRFLIRGKLNRNVPVLLDKNMLACIKLILEHRRDAKVPDDNPYVFGIRSNDPSIPKYFRACNLLRQYSLECGATQPERLRGTKLRKHIATTCVTLNLNENDISDLANFMGHKKDIHKTYYRQSVAHKDILQLSKLLQLAQGSIEESDASCDEETNEVVYAQSVSTGVLKEKKKRSTSPYGSVKRRKWTEEERKLVTETFQTQIRRRELPSLKEIGNFIGGNLCLKNRTPAQVKTWIYNQFKKTKDHCNT